MTQFTIKRIYDTAEVSDGYRVLVDRLWPRGVSKEKAALDEWAKDIAPSTQLRTWFGHDPEKFVEFSRRYRQEINENPQAVTIFKSWHQSDVVTLLYGARDQRHNEAAVLSEYLNNQ